MAQTYRSLIGGGMAACVVAVICCSIIVAGHPVSAAKRFPPETLVLYQFENRVPPTTDLVITATPSGNLTDIEYGTFIVIDNVLRVSADNTSKELGKVDGTIAILPDFSLFISYTFSINTTEYAGTISVQGLKSPRGQGEQAITGGTGDFKFARGYIETVTLTPSVNHFVYKNTFTVRY